MSIFIPWLFFRLLTSIFIALVSSLRPLTSLERSVTLFPPTLPFSSWLERIFLSPWLRWDAVWYLRIVENGYQAHDGTAQFHPLYPWLASIFSSLGINPILSLLLVSSFAGFGYLFVSIQLAHLDLSQSNTQFSLLLTILAPAAFVLFAPYSEALFLLCAVGSLYLARKQRWWLSGIAGGLAVLTRQQGLFLILPIAWELWEATGKTWRSAWKSWRQWLSLCLIPIGYTIWLIYRLVILNDLSVNLQNFHTIVYSLLISSSATEVVPAQAFIWPWKALYFAVIKVFQTPDLDIWVNIISALYFLVLLILGWKSMRVSYRIYVLAITIISFSYFTGLQHPYMGLPRHLLLAFPVFWAVTPHLNRPIIRPFVIILGSIWMLFMVSLFSLEAWIP
jgi:hypothetical protein